MLLMQGEVARGRARAGPRRRQPAPGAGELGSMRTATTVAPRLIRIAVFDATERRALRARAARGQAARRGVGGSRPRRWPAPCSRPSSRRAAAVAGLDLAAAYRPAGDGDEVGGDFYDVFQVGAGDWVVALGDVCGKGVDAAVVTALARHTIRARPAARRSPGAERRSTRCCATTAPTGSAPPRCSPVPATRRLGARRPAPGGPPLPLLVGRAATRRVGAPGIAPRACSTAPSTATRRPGPGRRVLLYTDGVTEGRRDRELFGDARLHDTVAATTGARPTA